MTNENIIWCDAFAIHQVVVEHIQQTRIALDIGCGIRPQTYIVPEVLICVEPYSEYIEILKKTLAETSTLILPLNALEALNILPNHSVDSIFMIDVIEHMSKEDGLLVLEQCNRVAREQIIIYTPLGFMPQEVHGKLDAWGLDGGSWQEHKSG